MDIREILSRRTDLSTFIVHLTRGSEELSAADALESILRDLKIEARTPFGHAVQSLEEAGIETDSQKVTCFTETPLEHISLLCGEIDGRRLKFEPYGIAITKRVARNKSINPVWYVDITPGHDWPTKSINLLIQQAIAVDDPQESPILKLTPLIEMMGEGNPGPGWYKREFWWEREWRHIGDFMLPVADGIIIICPEDQHEHFSNVCSSWSSASLPIALIDAAWSLEEIIGSLAGFSRENVRVI